MARKIPQPYFRAQRGLWYVQLGKRQINLGPDRDEAFKLYHQLMARPKEQRAPVSPLGPTVAAVFDLFAEWLQKHRSANTYTWYTLYLESLINVTAGGRRIGVLAAADLKPRHIEDWLDANPRWKTGRRGAVGAINRAFNWAVKAGHIGANPVAGVERPRAGRREQFITVAEIKEILALARDQDFHDLLELAWETGARPHELFTVEARFVDVPGERWIFPASESKGQRTCRVVYLSARALEITRRVALKNPDGPMLRNAGGKPWHRNATNCRFRRVRDRLGMRKAASLGLVPPRLSRGTGQAEKVARQKLLRELGRQHGVKYSMYAIRHSYCTYALMSGLDAVTVAHLMGHKDTSMISRHYSHLLQVDGHMQRAANRAKGESA